MSPNSRRFAGIVLVILLLVVVGAGGFWAGSTTAHGGVTGAMPLRGFGFRYPGIGLLGLVAPLLLVGLVVTFVALLVHEPGRPPAPPRQGDGSDSVDRLRELAAMHERGQLTEDEFAAAKRKLLGL